MANLNKPIIAAFDFDGTLTKRDSLFPFLKSIAGPVNTFKSYLFETPRVIKYLRGSITRQDLKEAILTRFLKGMSKEQINLYAHLFAANGLSKMVTAAGLARIKWHQQQGHRCVIVSANLEPYLLAWGNSMGFHDVIASKLEFTGDNKMTGKLVGLNCRGAEKVRRLKERVGSLEQYDIYAYGDSDGDLELLEAADHPFYRRLM